MVDDGTGAGGGAAAARSLRDAGCEVIYVAAAGAEALAELCLQEDVDAVWPASDGLGEALAARGAEDVVVAVGDVSELLRSLDRGPSSG